MDFKNKSLDTKNSGLWSVFTEEISCGVRLRRSSKTLKGRLGKGRLEGQSLQRTEVCGGSRTISRSAMVVEGYHLAGVCNLPTLRPLFCRPFTYRRVVIRDKHPRNCANQGGLSQMVPEVHLL